MHFRRDGSQQRNGHDPRTVGLRNTSKQFSCQLKDFDNILMVLHTFISITATIGNLLVLMTIWRSPNLHSPSNTLLFGLALSDFCGGVVSEPLHIGFQAELFTKSGKITSCTLTKVRNLISVFLTVVTVLTVTAMSVDRYLAINCT